MELAATEDATEDGQNDLGVFAAVGVVGVLGGRFGGVCTVSGIGGAPNA